MTVDQNRAIADELLGAIGSNADPKNIAAMFTEDVVFEVPGDLGALPWIGRQTGRAAVEQFVSNAGDLLARERFDVLDILASDTRAAVLGELASRVVATGRLIEMSFAIILTVSDGVPGGLFGGGGPKRRLRFGCRRPAAFTNRGLPSPSRKLGKR